MTNVRGSSASGPQLTAVTETVEGKTTDKGELKYRKPAPGEGREAQDAALNLMSCKTAKGRPANRLNHRGMGCSRLWQEEGGGGCPVYQDSISARRSISFLHFPSGVCLLWMLCPYTLWWSWRMDEWMNGGLSLQLLIDVFNGEKGGSMGHFKSSETVSNWRTSTKPWEVNKYIQIHIMCLVWWYVIYINLSSSYNKPK